MTTLIVGRCTGVTRRMAGNPNTPEDQWEETSIVVLSGMHTTAVRVANVDKFDGELPKVDDHVALRVSADGFLTKAQKQAVIAGERVRPAIQWVTFGREAELERLIVEHGPAKV